MKIKNIFLSAILSAVLLLSLASCRAGKTNGLQTVKETESFIQTETEMKSEEPAGKTEQKSCLSVSRTTKNNETVITETDKTLEKPTLSHEDKKTESIFAVTEKEKTESLSAATEKEKIEMQTTAAIPEVETVKVTVNCRHAAEYQSAHPEKEIFIPQNIDGIICTGEINLEQGDTALSVLTKELETSGVSIRESRGYVSGIGGLYEKACGGTSGWMFSINGEIPFASADKIAVNPGDEVVFYYVVTYGDSY